MKKILTILLCGVLTLGLIGCGSSKEDEEKKKEDDLKLNLRVVAQQIVEGKLKSPKSADFPWSAEEYKIEEAESTREGFKKYTVTSYVDAQNSFGAEIRSDFVVTFDFDGVDKFYEISCDIK